MFKILIFTLNHQAQDFNESLLFRTRASFILLRFLSPKRSPSFKAIFLTTFYHGFV